MLEAKRLLPAVILSTMVALGSGAPQSVNGQEKPLISDAPKGPSFQETLAKALKQQGVTCINRRYQGQYKEARGALKLSLFTENFDVTSNTDEPILGYLQPNFMSPRVDWAKGYQDMGEEFAPIAQFLGDVERNKFIIEFQRKKRVVERWLGRLYQFTDRYMVATFQPLRIGDEVYAYPDPDLPAGYPVHLSNNC